MANCFTSLLLAVVAFVVVAHAKTIPLISDKDNVTSQGEFTMMAALAAASQENVHSLDKTKDERETSSAVQDWSLVCQQLCGAALGGAACNPYCRNVTAQVSLKVQLANADVLMASGKQEICHKLCGLQLGDVACTCKDYIADDKPMSNDLNEATNVCALFCDSAHVTLTGCSPCTVTNAIDTEDLMPSIKTSKDAILCSINISKEATDSSFNTSNETMMHNKSAENEARHNGTATNSARASATTSETTTPNWKELCAALCKTGDGGSLCNCNLSPLMM